MIHTHCLNTHTHSLNIHTHTHTQTHTRRIWRWSIVVNLKMKNISTQAAQSTTNILLYPPILNPPEQNTHTYVQNMSHTQIIPSSSPYWSSFFFPITEVLLVVDHWKIMSLSLYLKQNKKLSSHSVVTIKWLQPFWSTEDMGLETMAIFKLLWQSYIDLFYAPNQNKCDVSATEL